MKDGDIIIDEGSGKNKTLCVILEKQDGNIILMHESFLFHNFSDADIMVHRIDDQAINFTHICDQNKAFPFASAGR